MHCIKLELKICEGCGCIWLREQNAVKIYCLGCTKKMDERWPRQRAVTRVRGRHTKPSKLGPSKLGPQKFGPQSVGVKSGLQIVNARPQSVNAGQQIVNAGQR
jgi:hypothetical protein